MWYTIDIIRPSNGKQWESIISSADKHFETTFHPWSPRALKIWNNSIVVNPHICTQILTSIKPIVSDTKIFAKSWTLSVSLSLSLEPNLQVEFSQPLCRLNCSHLSLRSHNMLPWRRACKQWVCTTTKRINLWKHKWKYSNRVSISLPLEAGLSSTPIFTLTPTSPKP